MLYSTQITQDFFENSKKQVEEKLKQVIEQYDETYKLKYFLSSGKRLRPLLCLLTFGACNGSDYQKALNLAAAIELHHSASLVHDDIVDGDLTRRSSPSYYKAFGIEDAILTGHRAIVLGFKCVLNHKPAVIKTLFDTWDESLKGEIQDIESRENAFFQNFDNLYFEVIQRKTASLFAAAAKLGSIEADAPLAIQQILCQYGRNIGIAYQLADDMQDAGKGREMLPLAWVLNRLEVVEKQSVMKLIDNGALPSQALLEVGVNAEGFFLKEINAAVNAAQTLAKSCRVADPQFRQMILQAPAYIVAKCMEN